MVWGASRAGRPAFPVAAIQTRSRASRRANCIRRRAILKQIEGPHSASNQTLFTMDPIPNPNPSPDGRPRSPHDVSPRTIALIFGGMLAGLAIGMLLVLPHYGPRKPRKRSALGHDFPVVVSSKIGRETNGMIWIPGSTFLMGSDTGRPNESPAHEVTVTGLWMDKTEVTNEEFEKFVHATGYQTTAERRGGALVFRPAAREAGNRAADGQEFIAGADWRHPEGPGSNLGGRSKDPVRQVSWDDAAAYARWAGKRLPTEAEWEHAARGGLTGLPYVWGSSPPEHWKMAANLWQGAFPEGNTGADGFEGVAPVASFPPNEYHLHDMAGNVREWCVDAFEDGYYAHSPKLNPKGPNPGDEGKQTANRAVRGGSFLSDENHGQTYRVSGRMGLPPGTTMSDVGFRCVREGP